MSSGPITGGDPAVDRLVVADVSLRFGGLAALSDVSFATEHRDVLGVVGANGAGKTSLINCISGTYKPTKGEIRLGDALVSSLHEWDRVDIGIGRTFQHPSMIPGLTVVENVLLGAHARMPTKPFGTFYRSAGFRSIRATWRTRALEILDGLGLIDHADRPVDELSYGDRKLVDLGRALIMEPKLLLLDEPTSGLTNRERVTVRTALADVVRSRPVSIVIIEHDMPFLTSVATRLIVLQLGRVVADGPVAETMRDPAVRASFLGTRRD